MTDPNPLEPYLDPGPRGEFSGLTSQSGRLLNALGRAQLVAAQNLLKKAIRAHSAGDAQRAEQLIQRAAQMPYDPREEESPGVRAASMLVYLVITDHFEASDADDMDWLDVVLAVHPTLDSTGQAEVASAVHGFVLQTTLFTVSPTERRRIRESFGDAPLDAELGDGPDSTVDQRHAIIRSLVMAAATLGDAYAAATPRRRR